MPAKVEFISAPWCGRCKTLRPAVEETCRLSGAQFCYVNMDDLDEDDPLKESIKALPTMRTRLTPDSPWVLWVPAQLEEWKTALFAAATATTADLDF